MKKSLPLILFFAISFLTNAQKPNWQNLDLQNDSVFGISTEKAYTEILVHNKTHRDVIVGVIDSGVDTAHEDLKEVIWINPKEKYNGRDNDHDGYAGDVHGWDFIGGPSGDVEQENLELVRLVRKGKATPDMISEYDAALKQNQDFINFYNWYILALDSMTTRMGKDHPTLDDFKNYEPQNDHEKIARLRVIHYLHDQPDYKTFREEVEGGLKHFVDERQTTLNPAFNPRVIVGDDTANAEEHFYGNPDVMGPGALHGTHVSGIIAAVRNNGMGIQGIADHVTILMIRTVPDGDERDKDVANAIRFATDHGCKVINMSFGKAYSPDKKVVDEAVRYALSKDVLLVHAAGNYNY
jgi:subtilisin family serine protease